MTQPSRPSAATQTPTSPIDILLAHNHWANLALLNTAKSLTYEQFHKRFEIGPGSVHDTLSHVLGAMSRWTRALSQQEMLSTPRFEAPQRTPDELLPLAQSLNHDLAAIAHAHPLDQTVTATRNGLTVTFVRSVILTHLTTHGVHHRAQCANMLRQLGVTPIPPLSVLEWSLTQTAS